MTRSKVKGIISLRSPKLSIVFKVCSFHKGVTASVKGRAVCCYKPFILTNKLPDIASFNTHGYTALSIHGKLSVIIFCFIMCPCAAYSLTCCNSLSVVIHDIFIVEFVIHNIAINSTCICPGRFIKHKLNVCVCRCITQICCIVAIHYCSVGCSGNAHCEINHVCILFRTPDCLRCPCTCTACRGGEIAIIYPFFINNVNKVRCFVNYYCIVA